MPVWNKTNRRNNKAVSSSTGGAGRAGQDVSGQSPCGSGRSRAVCGELAHRKMGTGMGRANLGNRPHRHTAAHLHFLQHFEEFCRLKKKREKSPVQPKWARGQAAPAQAMAGRSSHWQPRQCPVPRRASEPALHRAAQPANNTHPGQLPSLPCVKFDKCSLVISFSNHISAGTVVWTTSLGPFCSQFFSQAAQSPISSSPQCQHRLETWSRAARLS